MMDEETIKEIFRRGAGACYDTLDVNTGECANPEEWNRLMDETVKLFSKQIVSNTLTLADDNKDLIEVTERYGAAYHIEAVNGTTPSIDKLPLNQRVVYGDGDKYHFLLTKR